MSPEKLILKSSLPLKGAFLEKGIVPSLAIGPLYVV